MKQEIWIFDDADRILSLFSLIFKIMKLKIEAKENMANFVLQLPKPNTLNCFSIFASSNGTPPGSSSSGTGGPVILELPLDKIKRPLMRARANDPKKVKELMDSIKVIGQY